MIKIYDIVIIVIYINNFISWRQFTGSKVINYSSDVYYEMITKKYISVNPHFLFVA